MLGILHRLTPVGGAHVTDRFQLRGLAVEERWVPNEVLVTTYLRSRGHRPARRLFRLMVCVEPRMIRTVKWRSESRLLSHFRVLKCAFKQVAQLSAEAAQDSGRCAVHSVVQVVQGSTMLV